MYIIYIYIYKLYIYARRRTAEGTLRSRLVDPLLTVLFVTEKPKCVMGERLPSISLSTAWF